MASAQRARSPYRAALQAPILPATPGPGVVLESLSRAAMAPLLGAECERRGVAWADGGEVAAVEGGDLGDGEAFGQGDDGGVDGAEREVGVGGDEVGGAVEVGGCRFGELEVAGREGAEELGFEPRAGLAGKQVADLGDNQRRHEERFGVQVHGVKNSTQRMWLASPCRAAATSGPVSTRITRRGARVRRGGFPRRVRRCPVGWLRRRRTSVAATAGWRSLPSWRAGRRAPRGQSRRVGRRRDGAAPRAGRSYLSSVEADTR